MQKSVTYRIVNRYLPASCHAQVGIAESGNSGQPVANRHLVKAVEKAQCRFLIFQRILMPVIALCEFDSVGVPEAFVESTYL